MSFCRTLIRLEAAATSVERTDSRLLARSTRCCAESILDCRLRPLDPSGADANSTSGASASRANAAMRNRIGRRSLGGRDPDLQLEVRSYVSRASGRPGGPASAVWQD